MRTFKSKLTKVREYILNSIRFVAALFGSQTFR